MALKRQPAQDLGSFPRALLGLTVCSTQGRNQTRRTHDAPIPMIIELRFRVFFMVPGAY
jgi:hypothetical protein